MTAKERKIRGHEMALANARKRGDKAGIAKQEKAIRALGGAVAHAPQARGGKAKHKGKANPAPRKGKSSMRGGKRYRHNPDVDTSAIDAGWTGPSTVRSSAPVTEAQVTRVEKAAETVKDAVAAAREAAKEAKAAVKAARAEGKGASKEALAALRKQRSAEAKVAKAEKKLEAAAKKIEKRARKSGGSKSTMAKPTKAERSKAAKKGARTRKRNETAAMSSSAPKSSRRKAARKAPKSSAKSSRRKTSKTSRKRRNAKRVSHFPKVPKGFRKTRSRVSIEAKSRKSGKKKTFTKTRTYKSNPMSDLGQLAVFGAGALVGAVLADVIRRYIATMAPKGAKEPVYGYVASERLAQHPDGMQYAAQGLLGVAGLGAAYLAMKKSPGASRFLAGVGVGALVQVGLELVNYAVMPSLLKANEFTESNNGNRMYPLEQKYQQDRMATQIKLENDAMAAGKVVNRQDGTISGTRGGALAGLPAPQQTRQLPPAQGNRPVQQGTHNGQVAGAPGQVGCGGGGGCGGNNGMPNNGGCTGGRNCGCSSCSGANPGFGEIAPAATMVGATTAQAPRAGNINGPRQLGRPSAVIPMPRQGARTQMAFGGQR